MHIDRQEDDMIAGFLAAIICLVIVGVLSVTPSPKFEWATDTSVGSNSQTDFTFESDSGEIGTIYSDTGIILF